MKQTLQILEIEQNALLLRIASHSDRLSGHVARRNTGDTAFFKTSG